MIFIFLILGLFFPWFLGYIVLSMDKNIGLIKYFLAFPFGIGIITYQLFFYSIMGIGFNIILIFLPWILILSYIVYKNKIQFDNVPIKNIIGLDKINILLIFIILFYLVFVFCGALADKNDNYDSLSIWSFKAKAFFTDGKVNQSFFDYTRKYSQFDYPLLVPLSQSWMSITYGKWNNSLIKIISPLFYFSLVGIFFCVLIKITKQRSALIGTAVLSSFPVLVKYAKLPIADIPMTFYLFASLVLIYFIFIKNVKLHFIWPAAFLLFLQWTKNEGLLLSLIIIILTAVFLLRQKKHKDILKLLAICGFLALMNLPWHLFKDELNIYNQIVNFHSISQLNLGHIYFYTPIIVRCFINKTLITLDWYGLWVVYLLTIFIYRKKIFNNSKELILNFINISILLYASVYLLVKEDINLLLSWTSNRLILHIVPIVLFFIIIIYEENENIDEGGI